LTAVETPEQAVILVGGLGTRLAELTKNHPKPLLTVGDAPFLDELIWRLERYGFRRLLLLAGHRAEKFTGYMAQYFQDKSIDVELLVEPHPLGTAGALRFAADKLDRSFYLLNGDSLFDFNWLDLIPFSADRAPLIAMMRHGSASSTLIATKLSDFTSAAVRRAASSMAVSIWSRAISCHICPRTARWSATFCRSWRPWAASWAVSMKVFSSTSEHRIPSRGRRSCCTPTSEGPPSSWTAVACSTRATLLKSVGEPVRLKPLSRSTTAAAMFS
jgi:hypothetical protein